MPVLGAVIVMRPPAGPADLPSDPRLLVGEAHGQHVPVALEVGGRREADAFWESLLALPEVLDVQLAFAHYESNPEASPSSDALDEVSP